MGDILKGLRPADLTASFDCAKALPYAGQQPHMHI